MVAVVLDVVAMMAVVVNRDYGISTLFFEMPLLRPLLTKRS